MNCTRVSRCSTLSITLSRPTHRFFRDMGKYRGSRRPPAPKRPPLTHFLCLPLVTEQSKPQLETSLQRFRDAVAPEGLNEASGSHAEDGAGNEATGTGSLPAIHPKAIRPVGALHCTLGVMSLDSEQLAQAKSTLESLDVPSLLAKTAEGQTSEPLVISLKGLESMHAPEKTSILYSAPADSSERLYPFCLAVQQHFKDQGLLVEDDRKLKLHATILNTIYSKGKRLPVKGPGAPSEPGASTGPGLSLPQQHDGRIQGPGPSEVVNLKIDATGLLDRYKDFVWADNIVLDRLAICEMGAKKVTDGEGKVIAEQYTEVASIALPA